MADVEITVAGRQYSIACRAGGEDHLRTIAAHVDRKASEARAAVGGVNEARQLLFAALLLADEIAESTSGVPTTKPEPQFTHSLAELANRIEAVADTLENA